jgi:hypothetical protein
MTYTVVVAVKDQNVKVKVDAGDERSAHDIAHWLVSHSAHLAAHGVQAKPVTARQE